MSDTAAIDIINLQVFAQTEAQIARADHSFVRRKSQDRGAFIWQGTYQTIPMGIEADPAGYARALRAAIPFATTLRLPFNAYSFNPDGSLDPRFETFLSEAARQGFWIIFVYADGQAQRYGTAKDPDAPNATAAQILDALKGPIMARAHRSFSTLLDWMDRHNDVARAVWGLELMNEPATFKTGMERAKAEGHDARDLFVGLYAAEMVALADEVKSRFGGRILVGGFAYSADFSILAQTNVPGTTVSALDTIRKGIGKPLVWSAHLYPGWGETRGATSGAQVEVGLDRQYQMLGADDILVTETNAKGSEVYDPFSRRPEETAFASAYEWFSDHGIGIGWFPGAQTGASSLVVIGDDNTLSFKHPASYGAAMNAFTLDQPVPQPRPAGRVVTATFIPGVVSTEGDDPARVLRGAKTDGVTGIAFGLGRGGNDTIEGNAQADNFLFGGPGDSVLKGAGHNDYLYGQGGNDTLIAAGGNDHLFGGRGNDLLVAMGGYNELFGGPGADRFSVSVTGKTIIADFSARDGDTIDFRGHYQSLEDVLRRTTVLDYTGNGSSDLLIWHDTGGYTVILGMGAHIDQFAAALAEFTLSGPLPTRPLADAISGTPFTPRNGIDPDGINVPPPPRPQDNAGLNPVDGTRGNDTIEGTEGDDLVEAGPGNDVITEHKGNNLVFGGPGNDTITTGRQYSRIVLGDGDNLVNIELRNKGHDIWGGAGADRFNVTAVMKPTVTHIYDFDFGRDTLSLADKPIDLASPPAGVAVALFPQGRIVTINALATIYLVDPKLVAKAASEAAKGQADDGFDPHFDPANPRAHFGR